MVFWDSSDYLEWYDGYVGVLHGFFSSDVVYGNETVPHLAILDLFF